MPYFSVIIPTYNRYQQTKRAINSVLDQSYKDFELIVVDDGSTDQTCLLEKEFRNTISYIKTSNMGVSSARNTGINRATGTYIALLDSDDVWLPDKLLLHTNYIRSHPDIDIHQSDEIWIRSGTRVNPKLKHRKIEGYIFSRSLELCMISPSSVIIKKSLFSKYGLFDEMLPACEDYELWLRITPFEKIGLIEQQLNIRYAGHHDQLSTQYWGMDRFRIYAILKLLHRKSDILPEKYVKDAVAVLQKKISILYNGAVKRGNNVMENNLSAIEDHLVHADYNKIHYQSLLKK